MGRKYTDRERIELLSKRIDTCYQKLYAATENKRLATIRKRQELKFYMKIKNWSKSMNRSGRLTTIGKLLSQVGRGRILVTLSKNEYDLLLSSLRRSQIRRKSKIYDTGNELRKSVIEIQKEGRTGVSGGSLLAAKEVAYAAAPDDGRSQFAQSALTRSARIVGAPEKKGLGGVPD